MDAEHAWAADLEDPEGLEDLEEPEFWEDDELAPEELTACGAPDAPDGASPPPEGSVPDLVAAALRAGGDPALMSDAELLESLAGWHAVAARATARELRATEELLRRRRPRVWDRRADRTESVRQEDGEGGAPHQQESVRVMPAVVPSREAAAEIALALTATDYSAQAQVELTADLSRRLPIAFCELDAGRADLHRVKVLAEGTQFLSDEDAGQVDALLGNRLGELTSGDLRDKVRRAVIKIDPGAADRRRKRAERKARFVLYGNDDQTATAAVERMPAHLGAAVKARVNAIARAARAAGMTDPMPLLEAKVATGLLLDTLPDILPPHTGDDYDGHDGPGGLSGEGDGPANDPCDPGPAAPWDDGWPADWGATPPASAANTPTDSDTTQADHPAGEMSWPRMPAQAGRDGPGCHGLPAWLWPKTPGRIRLTVPWRTLTGIGPEPGELSWIGPITPAQARDLAAVAAADTACTWRVIITDDDGHATAITTLRLCRPVQDQPPGLVSEVTLTIQQTLAASLGGDGQVRDWIAAALGDGTEVNVTPLADLLAKAIPTANLAAAEAAAQAAADAAAGGCAHAMQAPGYRVPDRLRRWLTTRDRTCRNPVCRKPALRCDQDHTLAYDRGGRSCTCNLGPLCRVHHQLKQLPGWELTQDARGYFTWRTPAGLTYRKEPHRYAV